MKMTSTKYRNKQKKPKQVYTNQFYKKLKK